MSLAVEQFRLTTQTYGVPLVSTMKKYTRFPKSAENNSSRPGIILLLGHGVGLCKETWEPTIHDIYKIDDERSTGPIVREVWGLDCQNHGEAAILNEDVLLHNEGIFTIWSYGDALATLVRSGLLGVLNPDIHEIVLCGHSAGASAIVISTFYFNPPSRTPFSKIILVDPSMWSRQMEGKESELFKMIEARTLTRKDTWQTHDEALKWMKKRLPWKSWDDRSLDSYIKYGLRSLPTVLYPNKTGVTLTANRHFENNIVAGKRYCYDAVDRLNQICAHVPVHLIFGDKNDLYDQEFQNSIINKQEGRVYASVTRLANVGHFVPQEAPTELALAIMNVLISPSKSTKNKL